MAPCNCGSGTRYEWSDGNRKIVYKTAVEARAQVMRAGGEVRTIKT